jgi:hypothetical protein
MFCMAALIRLTVDPATQEQFHALEALVGESMMQAGGPPTGLMSHVAYPSGNGVQVTDVWSTEEQGRTYFDQVLRPLVHKAGLTPGDTESVPVWSFARP